VGKSTVIAIKASEFAVKNSKKSIMIISAVERQAYLLFSKVLAYLYDNYKKWIKVGKDRPTKSEIRLTNGSIIRCLPTGLDGTGIRGYTVDLLIADEAAFIPEDVWTAVTPMLSVEGSKKQIILLSTPHGREGFFCRCFTDPSFSTFHISSPECPRIDKEFLKRERARMTEVQYAQEYLGEFIDELRQWFPDDLIKKCMGKSRRAAIPKGNYYLGVDVAQMGEDESTFEILDYNKDTLTHVENKITIKTRINETVDYIIQLNKTYNFKKIYVDNRGVGAGVFDFLLKDNSTMNKVVAIDNARKSLDSEEKTKRTLMKEDLYSNLLMLMEKSKIFLLDDPEIFMSLKSVQFEYTSDTRGRSHLKIFGNYTHIAEGLIRGAWCVKYKNLNIWIKSF